MRTLLEDRAIEPVEETLVIEDTLVEEFDLERLARISGAIPEIEPPRFVLLEPAPRFRSLRRTLITALLAVAIVAPLVTLHSTAAGPAGPAPGGAATTTSDSCSVAD